MRHLSGPEAPFVQKRDEVPIKPGEVARIGSDPQHDRMPDIGRPIERIRSLPGEMKTGAEDLAGLDDHLVEATVVECTRGGDRIR